MDPAASPGFESIAGLELTGELRVGLEQDGISVPTPVQRVAIPAILEGKNVVVESGTGTGKTLAYLLPILQTLRGTPDARGMIIAPSTELCLQSLRVAERYKDPSINVVGMVAGGNPQRQLQRLKKGARLVFGTPGRILEMIEQGKLKRPSVLVFDEPEPILTSKGGSLWQELVSRRGTTLQLVLCAATFGSNSEAFIRTVMGPDVFRTKVNDDPLRSRIHHHRVRVADESKRDMSLAHFVRQQRCQRAIVFVNQPHLFRHLFRFLNQQGLPTVSVSRERSKLECQQALSDFRNGRSRILLTTDEAGTGLDVDGVDWVLHYELPSSARAYLHRAGRTGRAGQTGISVLWVGDTERSQLARIERELGIQFLPWSRDEAQRTRSLPRRVGALSPSAGCESSSDVLWSRGKR